MPKVALCSRSRRIQNNTKGGPGKLLTLSNPNPYPKSVRTPAHKLRKIPALWHPLGRFDGQVPHRLNDPTTTVSPDGLKAAIYARPPIPPLYVIHHTVLVMTISCKGQSTMGPVSVQGRSVSKESCVCMCVCARVQFAMNQPRDRPADTYIVYIVYALYIPKVRTLMN